MALNADETSAASLVSGVTMELASCEAKNPAIAVMGSKLNPPTAKLVDVLSMANPAA